MINMQKSLTVKLTKGALHRMVAMPWAVIDELLTPYL